MSWKIKQIVNGPYGFNPFRKYPRNLPCFCGSGLKFKKCCESQIYDVVPAGELSNLEDLYPKAIKMYKKVKDAARRED